MVLKVHFKRREYEAARNQHQPGATIYHTRWASVVVHFMFHEVSRTFTTDLMPNVIEATVIITANVKEKMCWFRAFQWFPLICPSHSYDYSFLRVLLSRWQSTYKAQGQSLRVARINFRKYKFFAWSAIICKLLCCFLPSRNSKNSAVHLYTKSENQKCCLSVIVLR